MIAMSKPADLFIVEYSFTKPVIGFVPSRRQRGLTIADPFTCWSANDKPDRFLNSELEDLQPHPDHVRDPGFVLKHAIMKLFTTRISGLCSIFSNPEQSRFWWPPSFATSLLFCWVFSITKEMSTDISTIPLWTFYSDGPCTPPNRRPTQSMRADVLADAQELLQEVLGGRPSYRVASSYPPPA